MLTEYRANPLGTDVVKPRLSWRIESPRRNTMQAAYQIQVGTSQAALTAGKSLLWDSGRITTDASIFRPYDGPAPTSATRYYWRVRVWDDAGNPSAWSTPAFWETGLLKPTDWSARWIGPSATTKDSAGAPAPLLRGSFTVKGAIRSARVYVTARGRYELELNGQRVGEDFFTPGWTLAQPPPAVSDLRRHHRADPRGQRRRCHARRRLVSRPRRLPGTPTRTTATGRNFCAPARPHLRRRHECSA